jgi:hypothetical protein
MKFSIETIVGDRYHATDSLTKTEVHDWLLNLEKNDILKIQTSDEYWEDIPEQLFELIKTGIKAKNYVYKMAKGHLWLEMEILID